MKKKIHRLTLLHICLHAFWQRIYIFCGKPKQTFSFLLVPTCTHDWWIDFFFFFREKKCQKITVLRNTPYIAKDIWINKTNTKKFNSKWKHSSVQKKKREKWIERITYIHIYILYVYTEQWLTISIAHIFGEQKLNWKFFLTLFCSVAILQHNYK